VRNKLFGTIGVIWGGAMLVSAYSRGAPEGEGAFAAGQTIGIVFAVLLIVIGAYYFMKRSN
jgi:hypothetical protein